MRLALLVRVWLQAKRRHLAAQQRSVANQQSVNVGAAGTQCELSARIKEEGKRGRVCGFSQPTEYQQPSQKQTPCETHQGEADEEINLLVANGVEDIESVWIGEVVVLARHVGAGDCDAVAGEVQCCWRRCEKLVPGPRWERRFR